MKNTVVGVAWYGGTFVMVSLCVLARGWGDNGLATLFLTGAFGCTGLAILRWRLA